MTIYSDNYPYNIEAPQRVYVQYSQDIDFDYSNGQYPQGEEYEGFIWENVYIPLPHAYGDLELGRHVWMRWRVGERDDWTRPMRFTDAFSNIEATEAEVIEGTDEVRFRLKYTLESGEIIYSEYITLTNGADGRGITQSEIRGTDLFLSYTDSTEENLGRVVGYDGNGFPSIGSDIPNNMAIVDAGGNVIWQQALDILDTFLSGTSPIDYTNGVISHENTNGNRHIPIGGSSGNLLETDGAGNYSWFDIDTALDLRIPWTALDDTAGATDTDKLYSADKITSLIAGISAFGIKYSVALYSDLASIPSPNTGELAVVTSDPLYPNRPVYQYSGAVWDHFFDLDADHNHDDRYYQKIELQTAGQSSVHWDNITNKPTFYEDWIVIGDSGSLTVEDGDTLNIVGGTNITTSISGSTLTIDSTSLTYIEGDGIDIAGDTISHEDTSSISNTTNLNGTVVQNLTFDTFGHVLTQSSINLDTRYSLLSHTHPGLDTRVIKVDLGTWNMQSTAIKSIITASYGIDIDDVISVEAWVRSDSTNESYFPIGRDEYFAYNPGSYAGAVGINTYNGTVYAIRSADSIYTDTTSFTSTSFNRGWVVITYTV